MIKICCYIGILVIYVLAVILLTIITSMVSGTYAYDDDMTMSLLVANIIQAFVASLLIYVLIFERIPK